MHEAPLATISLADAPICPRYLDSLRALGIVPIVSYKWGNAISADLTSSQLEVLQGIDFVRSIRPVGHAQVLSVEPSALLHPANAAHPSSMLAPPTPDLALSDSGCGYDPVIYEYGGSQPELDRINVWPLQAMGFDGAGVRLGMLDVGFNWSGVSSLDKSNVLFEHDYVFQDSSTVNPQDDHGTTTMSTAMGYLPDTLIGPAYRCSVMLAHTEDINSERNIEEDNYAAALEDFEARGVEITSSSLGYFTFDSGQHSYSYADMNGHTAICTQAVERAAKLGVLVVTAMGNNGADSTYPYEEAPADADSILAVGALDVNDSIAGFSARGPTYDGRLKPDICAPGVNCFAQHRDGTFTSDASGTSYATPLTSGACCLIEEAHPGATAQQIRRAIMVTGSNAAHPDTAYGWGRLNAYAAALELGPVEHLMSISADSQIHVCVGAADQFGITSISIQYYFSIDGNLHIVPLALAADSLIYSGTVPDLPAGGQLYYRITLSDGAGASTDFPDSGWNELQVPPSQFEVQLAPNPAGPEVTIHANELGDWMLFDQTGKPIRSGSLSFPSTPIPTIGLSSGAYYFRFTSRSGETKVVPIAVDH